MTVKSLSQNGISFCTVGKENYTTFKYRGKTYYQYDYRHTDGALFSTVRQTLEECRSERDRMRQKCLDIKSGKIKI